MENDKPKSEEYRSINICSDLECANDNDNLKINCVKCQRNVHYACTGLPPYQIRLFKTKGYRGYICGKCVPVSTEFKESISSQEESFIEIYRKEIKACENIIEAQKDNQKKLLRAIESLKCDARNRRQEKEDLCSLIDTKINSLEDKIKQTIANEINGKTKEFEHQLERANVKSFAEIVKIHDDKTSSVIPNFRKLLHEEKMKKNDERNQDRRTS